VREKHGRIVPKRSSCPPLDGSPKRDLARRPAISSPLVAYLFERENFMNMRYVNLSWILGCVMLAPKAAAQAQFEWQATHDGGHGQIADYGSCAAVDSSGNIFLASQIGLVFGLSEYNVDINKYSSSGVLLWTRNFDLPLSTAD
jgi:hypothetical protein